MMKKSKFKKIAAIACTAALTGVLAFSLTACDNTNDNNDGNDPGSSTTQSALQLDKTTATVEAGKTVTINVTSSTTGTITWSSSDTTVATVAANASNSKICTVSGLKAGTATIKAKDGDIEATCTVTVTAAAVETVTIKRGDDTVSGTVNLYGANDTVTLTATASKNSEITWVTGDATIATVADGVVTAVAAGETTITAKVSDEIKATVTVKVVTESTDVAEGGEGSFTAGWRYYQAGATVPSCVRYGDEAVKIKYSWAGGQWYGLQLFHKNEGAGLVGKDHSLSLIVVAPQAGNITVNSEVQELKAGENKVTVESYTGSTLSIQFGVDGAQEGYDGSCFTGTDVEFLFKDIVFTSTADATLQAPEFSINSDKVVTITDTVNSDIAQKEYQLGFYNKESGDFVSAMKVESGDTLDLSGLGSATYTVRIQAYSTSSKIINSDWSEETQEIVWSNDNTIINAVLGADGRPGEITDVEAGSETWYYYYQDWGSVPQCSALYVKNNTIHVENLTGNTEYDWSFRLYYRGQTGQSLTMTVRSDAAGTIAVKDGNTVTNYALTVGEDTEITVNDITSLVIFFGANGPDNKGPNINNANVTIGLSFSNEDAE